MDGGSGLNSTGVVLASRREGPEVAVSVLPVARRDGTGFAAAFAVVGIVAILAVTLVFFLVAPRDPSTTGPTTSPSPTNGGGVPVGQDGGPEAIPEEEVRPFVTSVVYSETDATVTVRAFIPGQSEENGSCRATLTGTGGPWDASATAYVEVATTTCLPMVIMVDAEYDASWTVVVEYESATLSIESEETGVSRE